MAPPDLGISPKNVNERIAACQIFSEVPRKAEQYGYDFVCTVHLDTYQSCLSALDLASSRR
jgi:hypothetical protein